MAPSNISVNQQHMIGPSSHQQGRTRIAPVNSAMLASARSRDPRLLRMGSNNSNQQAGHPQHHPLQRVPPPMLSSAIVKTLPRIPKFSQSNSPGNKSSRDNDRNRDPRSRRNKEKEDVSKSNKSPNSKDKSKSSSSSSKSTSSRDRKKSGSSDDSSPRKKNEDKSSKSPSSHHQRVSHYQTKTASKSNEIDMKDVDLRIVPGMESMKPDSTTNITKTNKDKLLNDLLNGEDLKSSHNTITSDNGKENKQILVNTINRQTFIMTIMM